jgi:hypothetical protein
MAGRHEPCLVGPSCPRDEAIRGEESRSVAAACAAAECAGQSPPPAPQGARDGR